MTNKVKLYCLFVNDKKELQQVTKTRDKVESDLIKEIVEKDRYTIQIAQYNMTEKEFKTKKFFYPKHLIIANCFDKNKKIAFKAFYNFWEDSYAEQPYLCYDLYDDIENGKNVVGGVRFSKHVNGGILYFDNLDTMDVAIKKLEKLVVSYAECKFPKDSNSLKTANDNLKKIVVAQTLL